MRREAYHSQTETRAALSFNEINIIFAGFGGQGVQSIGMIIATAAMREEKEVLFRPDYEGKIRSGFSTCVVCISDQSIWSPGVMTQYDMLVALDKQALKHFEKSVKPGGILIWEANIAEPPKRDDIHLYKIPAYQKATEQFHNVKVMNMVVLGALAKIAPIVKLESILAALPETIPTVNHDLIPINKKAIQLGFTLY